MKTPTIMHENNGFTLVELMLSVTISAIVMGIISWTYTNQKKIYRNQEAIVDIQQNLRGGMYLISQEIRMAGYDPQETAGTVIQEATVHQLRFTQDITDALGNANDGNGVIDGPNEDITIAFDNVTDRANPRITRDTDGPGGAPPQPFIDNVDFLEFLYTLKDGTETTAPPADFFDKIKTIQISMLVRSANNEPGFFNNITYTRYRKSQNPAVPKSPLTLEDSPYRDNYRRRMLTTTVQCRNAAL